MKPALGFGTCRLPMRKGARSNADIDLMKCSDLYLRFVQSYKHFDLGHFYHDGMAEKSMTLLSDLPRDSYALCAKLPMGHLMQKFNLRKEAILEEQLKRTGTDHFDYYFLHAMNRSAFTFAERKGIFDWLSDLKTQGICKQIGFSFHDNAQTLETILALHPEMDAVQLQINWVDWESPIVQSRLCYETAVRYGMKIFVMEPLKGGSLVKAAPPSLWFRFVSELPNVEVVLSGMNTMAQLEENIGLFQSEQPPLSEDEWAVLTDARDRYLNNTAVQCTKCGYCTDVCSAQLPIPKYLDIYNSIHRGELLMPLVGHMQALPPLSRCKSCRKCEKACPQAIKITDTFVSLMSKFPMLGDRKF